MVQRSEALYCTTAFSIEFLYGASARRVTFVTPPHIRYVSLMEEARRESHLRARRKHGSRTKIQTDFTFPSSSSGKPIPFVSDGTHFHPTPRTKLTLVNWFDSASVLPLIRTFALPRCPSNHAIARRASKQDRAKKLSRCQTIR